MTANEIAELLPARICSDIYPAALKQCLPELGGNVLLFKRVRYFFDDDAPQWLGLNGFEPPKAVWASECVCTACRNRYYLGYAPGSKSRTPGVIIPEGEDGVNYTGVPDDPMLSETVRANQSAACPDCDANVILRPAAWLKRPKTFRCTLTQVVSVERYTALLYWQFRRTINPNGKTSVVVCPFRAVVLLDNRRFLHFRYHPDTSQWQTSPPVEPSGVCYPSADGGGMMHMKNGALVFPRVPDLSGMSGEKTGLTEYIESAREGGFPALYLRFWAQYPSVENVVKAGWGNAVADAIRRYVIASGGRNFAVPDTLETLANWIKSAPAEILDMTRAEVRTYAADKWTAPKLEEWTFLACCGYLKPGEVPDFLPLYEKYGDSLRCIKDLNPHTAHKPDIRKLDRYLSKQEKKFNLPCQVGLSLFVDYRVFSERLGLLDDATDVELWPPNLHAAHDRAARLYAVEQSAIADSRFLAVRETWKSLETSDGKICARLPLSNADLKREGHTLHHCVGSYGESHVNGNLIIFIRHARRPERPWFTLNIDTTGKQPREVQLHGYGNEHAGNKRLSIPREVRAFVDDWKKSVLAPAFAAVRKAVAE